MIKLGVIKNMALANVIGRCKLHDVIDAISLVQQTLCANSLFACKCDHLGNCSTNDIESKARIPTEDLIPKNIRCRNQHSLAFQIPSPSKEAYTSSFLPQTIMYISDWNYLPDYLIFFAEMSDDCVSKFASLVRARD